jgi:hypothetical protein
MKSFRFRLERVLTWRGMQLALAEAKVEQLIGSLRTTDAAMAELVQRRAATQSTLGRGALISGANLKTLEISRIWAIREEKKLDAQKQRLQQSIEVQNRCVADARRGVKLVERLKEQRYEKWRTEGEHELAELTAESAISQWRRLNHR